MSLLQYCKKLSDFYSWSMSIADPRVESWFLMQSPWPTLAITLVYLLVVSYGPKYMSARKPFSLKWVMVVYNLAMSVLNLYIGYELAVSSTARGYNYYCQPVNYSNNVYELRIASALWWYYFSRLIEMSDSLIFILRKKTNQLSFLHIYHHSTMFLLWWIGIKWVAGGSAFLAAMINSFIHVFMYLYYGLSALGPWIKKYLWWKKYLTLLQLAQFSSAMSLGIRAIVVGCDFPLWMQYALVVYMVSFLILFGDFYIKVYCRKKVLRKIVLCFISHSLIFLVSVVYIISVCLSFFLSFLISLLGAISLFGEFKHKHFFLLLIIK
ncbi:very long chain fatty acid elongase 4-like [Artemia franciscana]|uniref:very long chain fatty acid elongase 4-like n=1 Tax=Artemia franciscana TaxID=6661 RepID=UPI0032DB77EA